MSSHYVYRLFDSEDRALYVGCTTNPKVRITNHKAKPWGPRIDDAKTSVLRCVDERIALDTEFAWIQTLKPQYNGRDNPHRWPQLENPISFPVRLDRQSHHRLRWFSFVRWECPMWWLVNEAIEQWLERQEAAVSKDAAA